MSVQGQAERGARRLAEMVERARAQMEVIDGVETDELAPKCPACDGLGMVRLAVPFGHPDFGKMVACPRGQDCSTVRQNWEQRQRALQKMLKSAGLPDFFQEFTFESWDALSATERSGKEEARFACELFAQMPYHYFSGNDVARDFGRDLGAEFDRAKNSLMLWGDVGTGKTGLIAATMQRLVAQGEPVLYIRADDIIGEVQNRYGGYNHGDPTDMSVLDVMGIFGTARVLVVDDFRKRKLGDDSLDKMENIIRKRYGNQLPTLMTTNCGQDEFTALWGEQTADVIKAMCHWIPMTGAKLRQVAPDLRVLPKSSKAQGD